MESCINDCSDHSLRQIPKMQQVSGEDPPLFLLPPSPQRLERPPTIMLFLHPVLCCNLSHSRLMQILI